MRILESFQKDKPTIYPCGCKTFQGIHIYCEYHKKNPKALRKL